MKNNITEDEKKYHDKVALDYSKRQKSLNGWQICEMIFIWKKIHQIYKTNNSIKILDIGCGPAVNASKNIDYFKIYKNQYTGLDLSDEFSRIAANEFGLNVISADFLTENEFLKNKKYDVVLALGFLHHLESIDIALERISSLANKGAYIFFRDPNENAFKKWTGDSPHEHPINPDILVKKARDNGLLLDKIFYINSFFTKKFIESTFLKFILKYRMGWIIKFYIDVYVSKMFKNDFLVGRDCIYILRKDENN
ncbi:hypothetical protein C0584_01770 [Candidatus Parcubacteria bacterium]|nr:MAG: hypothetical protein C0584_01770 [Candidatus Parcubacteria bacterium]